MCFLFTTKETKPVLRIAEEIKKKNVVVRGFDVQWYENVR